MSKRLVKRITVKIGTRVLTDSRNRIDKKVISSICAQIAKLMDKGLEVIVVSSGAIGSGLGLLKIQKKEKSLSELQAIASVGQNHLMDIYNECLGKHKRVAGQILLTQEDFNDRKRFLNIRYTINTLLKYKAVPVINENDSVSTEEIKCGDNDRLSSMVADLANSDMLVILTNVEGLFDNEGKLIREVAEVTSRVRSLCWGKECEVSTGGMATKLDAAKNAAQSGIECVIAKGRRKDVVLDIVKGKKVGTRFKAAEKKQKARKRWIAFSIKAKGKIAIDAGARKALVQGSKSLLPGGIVEVRGSFGEGAVVDVVCDGKTVAKGITNYSSGEVQKIKGLKTSQIEGVLGYKDYDEVIHRDNLAVI